MKALYHDRFGNSRSAFIVQGAVSGSGQVLQRCHSAVSDRSNYWIDKVTGEER